MRWWRFCSIVTFLAASVAMAQSSGSDAGVVVCPTGLVRPKRLPQPDDASGGAHPPSPGMVGDVIVKCTLSVEGKAQDCQVIQSIGDSGDRAVLHWLSRQQYTPITCAGKPVAQPYAFNFHFR